MPARSTHLMRSALLAKWALVLAVAAFAVGTLPGVRSGPRFHPVLDGWVQGSAYVLMAVVSLLGLTRVRGDRRVWVLVCAAVTARALAFAVYLAVVRRQNPIPYPSVADALWLATCGFLVLALLAMARRHFPGLSLSLALDALIGVLIATGLVVDVLYETLDNLAGPDLPRRALVTNLAYPVLDVMLLLLVIGVLVASAWRPPPALLMLAAGVAGVAVCDTVYLAELAEGSFHPGTALSVLSLGASAMIAWSVWLPRKITTSDRSDVMPGLVIPGVLALSCVALLVYASVRSTPLLGVVLATGGVVTAVLRSGLTFRDVRHLAQVRREARTDELTGLANRRAFNEVFEAELHHRDAERPLALLVLDLDNFKDVNDLLGHHRGDELLTLIAPRFQLALRSEDLLARIGGDEFAVVVREADSDQAAQVAERLRAGLRRPFDVAGHTVAVAASVGIALFPEDGRSAAEMFQHADSAMYEAKYARTGQSFYRAERSRLSQTRLQTTLRLRQAIDGGEIVLHYQPQVALATGEVIGVEALVRWQHPERGLLGPGSFLTHAESGDLMGPLTSTVLEQALRQSARWREQGRHVPVAVNLSVSNLLDRRFPERVGELLDARGLPGDSLVLELTEDLFLANPALGQRVVGALVERGVTLQVDDYGTGYSTLGYLRDLRGIGGLKLDRSFVQPMDSDERVCAIVESTIGLAAALGLDLIAEGVETEAVRDRLALLGCRHAQGFLFSRPVPADLLNLGVIDAARALVR